MLHIGGDTNIPLKDIIAIINAATAKSSPQTVAYLESARRKGLFASVSDEECKSYVICERKGKRRIYLSPISPATLFKRSRARRARGSAIDL